MVALTFEEGSDSLETPTKQDHIRSDLAHVLYLPIEAVDIGGYDSQLRSMDIVVFPFNPEAAEKIKKNMDLARKMVPGVQHMIAAQLVSQVRHKGNSQIYLVHVWFVVFTTLPVSRPYFCVVSAPDYDTQSCRSSTSRVRYGNCLAYVASNGHKLFRHRATSTLKRFPSPMLGTAVLDFHGQ